jgi:NAD(P)-dependent dehydrogenase (short-subunit alcohol dehydrogenase family)
MRRFEGKIALVTGSTQGVGAAVARRFAEGGAAGILVTGRDADRGASVAAALRDLGADTTFVPADLADAAACGDLVAAADDRFGRIDILVNAAGLTARGSIVDTTVDLFDRMFAVNVRAPFLLMQGAIRIMRREGIAGTIVNVGSVTASGGVPFLAPYAASKAALAVLTKNIAYSVAWDRIRVNCLSPGWMDTPGEDAIQRAAHGAGDGWQEDAEAQLPFGQLITLDEVSRAIAFLASSESGIMTGAVVHYDQSIPGAGPSAVPRPEMTPR